VRDEKSETRLALVMNTTADFKIVEHEEGACLVACGPWNDGLDRIVEEQRIRVVQLSRHAGWPGGDLSFLAAHPNVIGVQLYDKTIGSLDVLRDLPNLRYLCFDSQLKGGVDFTNFPQLRTLKFDWAKGAESIGACVGLVHLNLGAYRLADLEILSNLHQLEVLHVMSRSLTSLRGIGALRSLRELYLSYCTKLTDLSGLDQCNNLNHIRIQSCKAFKKLDDIAKTKNLNLLYISDCGTIESLLPLRQCNELVYLYAVGNTSIVDSELAFLLEMTKIEDIRMADKRHYKPRIDEIVWAVKQRSI
jgi:hypothetical protein